MVKVGTEPHLPKSSQSPVTPQDCSQPRPPLNGVTKPETFPCSQSLEDSTSQQSQALGGTSWFHPIYATRLDTG
jgi:hypothetical protein